MPNIYESGLSPLIELAKTALPGRRVVTAEDVARLLDPTTTRLEGAGWGHISPTGGVNDLEGGPQGSDVPAMLITPRMRDIYRRLRDEGRPGVPLYSKGGSVSNASIEDHLLGKA